jgi:zinc protease
MWRSELMAYFRKKFFEQSPYSMLTIGSKDVVANVTREDVSGFHAEHVTAPNSVLAVYGDIDPTKAEALVQRFFSAMPSEKPQMPTTAEPSFEQPRLYIKGKSPERRTAGIAVGFVGMEVDNTDDRRDMAVLDTIMSGYRYPTGWLHESLRGGDADYVYEVHAINLPGLTPGFFQVYAACQPEKVNEVYGIITEQLDKARRGEFTKEELDRAKTIIETTETMGRQTNSQRAMDAAIDVLYGLGHDYHDEYIEQVKSVTLDDVHEIAKKYFTTPVVVVVTPDPDAVDIGIEPTVVEGEK